MFVETEPADMALSYEEYEDFLNGTSYEVISNRQSVRMQRDARSCVQKAFDKVQEQCRYLDYVQEMLGENEHEIPKLKYDLYCAFEEWESRYNYLLC